MAGPSSRDRFLEFAGDHRLPLDGEHPVWAECSSRIEAASHGEIIALAQRAATPDPSTTTPSVLARKPTQPKAERPAEQAVLEAVRAAPGTDAAYLAASLGTTAAAMAPVMAALIKASKVRTTGARRAKRYFEAEAPIHAPAGQPAPPLVGEQDDAPFDADEPPSAERRRDQD